MFINCVFVVECVYNKETGDTQYFLRTNEGRVLNVKSTFDFTENAEKFFHDVLKNIDVH